MSKQIFLDAPQLGALEKKYLTRAIDAGYVSTAGPFVSQFEEKFARYVGTKKAISTQSGTAALHMALHELGIGKGDEVIVPVLTFVATVNPVVYVGAKPVFVDVDRQTWNIDVTKIEQSITKKTKAIIPVHLYGNPCDMATIMDIAKRHRLYVIEDATESLGAMYTDKHTGTLGDLGCFSFNGNKTITTGGGGMVVGNNVKHIDHIKFLVNQARDESRGYYHPEVGFNYRMTNVEAAIGLAQMERLSDFVCKRKEFHSIYENELQPVRGIRFQAQTSGAQGCRWLSCIVFEKNINIQVLQKKLKSQGVPTRRIFMPVTEFPHYKDYTKTSYPNALSIHERGLCLPGSSMNSKKEILYICKTLKKILL